MLLVQRNTHASRKSRFIPQYPVLITTHSLCDGRCYVDFKSSVRTRIEAFVVVEIMKHLLKRAFFSLAKDLVSQCFSWRRRSKIARWAIFSDLCVPRKEGAHSGAAVVPKSMWAILDRMRAVDRAHMYPAWSLSLHTGVGSCLMVSGIDNM